jgi:hypothetical protein
MKLLRSISIATLVLLLLASCNRSDVPASNSPSNSASSNGNPGAGNAGQLAAEQIITIPEGTHITVRLGETLSSNHSQPGQDFSATVAEPVTVDGRTVIEPGAPAHGIVVDAKGMGHFKGGALLHVRLVSVTIHGRERQIETAAHGAALKGKGKRSAIAIAGGAGAGALIGGLIGGGKGAGIGVLAGGGAGTAGAAFTGNHQIVFPAETAMTFRLLRSVEVR